MQKLLGCKKVFGRCRLHGSNCGVSAGIQSIAVGRNKEKRDLRKEINGEMAEWFKALPC